MQAGTALIGRRLLAAFVAVMLMASVMLLFAESPARADHIPPDEVVAQVNGPDGTNSPGFWEDYLADLGVNDATCDHINEDGGDPYELGAPPAGQVWVMLVVKQATDNYVFLNPDPNHDYPTTGDQSPGFSHAMECYAPEPEDTTTTTEAEETTTTEAEETTTTQAEETTTTVEDTTTTTIEDEVLPTVITTSTTAAPTTTVEDEVLDTEVLPFTGGENDMLALLAGGLGLLGALVLASTRRMEEN
jgi:hypothetical protein